MVQTLTVTCPHCNQVSEIYLSTNACVIILNCPSCVSPIMYFDHKIFVLTQNQVDAIKNKTRSSAVMKMLEKIAQPQEQPVVKSSHKQMMQQNAPRMRISCDTGSVGVSASVRQKYIGEDDVTNLKIDLALCNDSAAFIKSLQ